MKKIDPLGGMFDKYEEEISKNTHHTADDMFEALGYEETQPLAHLIRFTRKNNNHIININFNLASQVYYVDNRKGIACDILKTEHQAIHQKLIELGWVE